jgi:hypothetical protein
MAPKTTSLKTSIYLDDETKQILAAREVGPGTRSEVIRACVTRYAEICRREKPDLHPQAWQLIFAVLDAKWLAAGHSPIHVPATLADSSKPGAKALGAKLGEMFFAELVAVLDEAEQHWAAKGRGEEPATQGGT